jgi:fucose 4-O-acetylase-like acetyltransferase
MKKKKDQSIETLRGIAIILMVAGHVIGHNTSTGMKVEDDSLLRYFYYSFQYLRMPLFTVISGYVYSLRPVQSGKLLSFFKGKANRILVPMIAVGIVQYLFRVYMPGINKSMELKDIWRILFFSFDQFWFLQSIFLVFVVAAFLDVYNLMNNIRNWIIICFLAFLIYISLPTFNTTFFSINGFFRLLPFFILGCGLKRYEKQIFNKAVIIIFLVIMGFTIFIQQLLWFFYITVDSTFVKILSSLIAITGISLLFKIRRENKLLARLGYYAFGIYLLHVFGTAGSRWLIMKLGDIQEYVTFTIGLIAGLGVPVLIELVIIPYKIPRKLFLGLK